MDGKQDLKSKKSQAGNKQKKKDKVFVKPA